MSCSTYMPPLVVMLTPAKHMKLQAVASTTLWEMWPGQASTTILVMVSMMENWVPRPRNSSIRKNNSALADTEVLL